MNVHLRQRPTKRPLETSAPEEQALMLVLSSVTTTAPRDSTSYPHRPPHVACSNNGSRRVRIQLKYVKGVAEISVEHILCV